MIFELHLLQNFSPSCLNRDDTGSPKDCEFGGYRRARISSQCLKRSARLHFREHDLLKDGNLATRTKRLVQHLCDKLVVLGRPAEAARTAVINALAAAGLKAVEDDEDKTQYLLFLGEGEISALASLIQENFDALAAVKAAAADEEGAKKKTAKQQKSAARDAVPPQIIKAVKAIFDGGKAADLALFGRMLADMPDRNIDAAAQVAHAISTNKVSMEMDYYTAVDDLKPDDNQGADMIGSVEFNSACFYRYVNVDLKQLLDNLQGDAELAAQALDAFVRASIHAVPSGKQSTTAAQNPPSFILAVVRRSGCWSLANAFAKPVTPSAEQDLTTASAGALDRYWSSLTRMYGQDSLVKVVACSLDDVKVPSLASSMVPSVSELIAAVRQSAQFNGQQR